MSSSGFCRSCVLLLGLAGWLAPPAHAQFTDVSGAGAGQANVAVGGDKSGGIAFGDLNRDGCLDIVVNTTSGTIDSRILMSDCATPNPRYTDMTATLAAGFADPPATGPAAHERSVVIGDLNNDGHVDIVRNTFTSLEIYLNNLGSGTFNFGVAGQPNQTFARPTGWGAFYPVFNTEGLTLVDADADGDLDLLVENHDDGVVLLANDGGGSFAVQNPAVNGLPVSSGGSGDYIASGDFDLDGDVDFIARKPTGHADIYRNDGSGVFSAAGISFDQPADNSDKGGVIFCDFDADGDLDLYWADNGTSQIWRNDRGAGGTVTWVATGQPFASSGVTRTDRTGAACGDVDSDGDVDLFLTGDGSGVHNDGLLFINNGSLSFTQNNLGIVNTDDSYATVFADYDNDGDVDLLINRDGGVQLWRNGSTATSYLNVVPVTAAGAPALGTTVQVFRSDGTTVASATQQISGGDGNGSGGDGAGRTHHGLGGIGEMGFYEVVITFPGGVTVRRCVQPSSLPAQTLRVTPATASQGCVDSDSDGVPDVLDEDDDNDGIPDATEVALFPSDPSADHDNDGVPDYRDEDFYSAVLVMPALCPDTMPNDGVCDSLPPAVDADEDGVPNHLDRDSDDDGLTDAAESGATDANGDGSPDACVSVNLVGVCLNGAGTPITVASPPNTDGPADTLADYLDLDSDGDGINDAVEAHDLNGNQVIGGGEAAPVMSDHDGDGIDDAFDPDCTAVGTPAGCAAAGQPVTAPPYDSAEDADTNGTPDWLQVCGDSYVTGAEGCDTGGASATCTAACLLTNGEPCIAGGACASGTCNSSTMTCQDCDDTTAGGTDMGCTMASPACVVSGGTATCEVCDDSATGTATDDGCGGSTPLCEIAGGTRTCVACLDTAVGMADLGCAGGTPVCDTSGTNTCVSCENNDPGTAIADVDFGCMGAAPFCDASGAAPVCIACLGAANCSDGNDCTQDVCAGGSCSNPSEAAGVSCGTGDACDGAGSCVDCVNDMSGAATDSGCAAGGPFCDAAMGAAGMCVECLSNTDCGSAELCNPSGMCVTGCSVDADCAGALVCDTANMLCVTCVDSSAGGGTDNGCEAAAPVCAGAMGMGTAGTMCVECTDSAHCAGAAVCDTGTNTCTACVDDQPDAMTDTGCSAATPVCDTSAGPSMCEECTTSAHCSGFELCSMDGVCEPPDSDNDGVPDDMDVDDDNDGILDTVESAGSDLALDSDNDGIPDYADVDEQICPDTDADGVCDTLPTSVDNDGDGIPNQLDLDADGDGIPDTTEGHDANMDGAPDTPVPAAFADMDGDGLADAYDPDSAGTGAPTQDTDGDSRPDFLDGDSDDDGLSDRIEGNDVNGDGVADVLPLGVDADGDGIDDAYDPDQGGTAPAGPDDDSDGFPDYLDVDSDGDGILDTIECRDPTTCPDTDRDGTPDYLDEDADGDGIPDGTEGHDVDADGVPDVTPSGTDTDGDGLDDAFDVDDGGSSAPLPDRDRDGMPDYRDVDDDEDGVATPLECTDPTMPCPDGDMDGVPDYLDPDTTPTDTDMDGIPDVVECSGDIATCPDTDGDGMPDHMDDDDDGDGVPTATECVGGPTLCDLDMDSRPNHLDIDSDGDGIVDRIECAMSPCEDTDGDGTPDLWDLDSDGDGIVDAIEGHDADMDGVPDVTASSDDLDGDGLDDAFDPDNGGTMAPLQDTDGDGTPDWRDDDDDGDGLDTSLECTDPSMACPDANADGTPDYLDAGSLPTDTDGDGIPDVVECPPPGDPVVDPTNCPDTDGDGMPNFNDPDDDNDGIPTADENYDGDNDPTDQDSDADGLPDYLDTDDDNDGLPTEDECVSFAAGCADTDGDGRPDYLDVCGDGVRSSIDLVTSWEECDDGNTMNGDGCDSSCRLEASAVPDDDMDGVPTSVECPPPADPLMPTTCPDSDGDGMPDFNDPDDDNDTIPTMDELGDGGADNPRDTDGDGTADYLDDDDDDDTIPTATEVADGNGLTPPNDDVDDDGVPNHLDTDSDGDGIDDADEPNDADGNGVPDYLESVPSVGGLAGGALCSVRPGPTDGSRDTHARWLMMAAAFGLLLRRRRR